MRRGDEDGTVRDVELTSSYTYIKNTSTYGAVLTEHLWKLVENLIQPELQERSPCNRQDEGKREKRRCGERTCTPGGSYDRGRKGCLTLGTSLTGQEFSLERQGASEAGEESLQAGMWPHKAQRDQHRWSWPHHCASQPQIHACWCVQWLASADRPGGTTWFGHTETAQRVFLATERKSHDFYCVYISIYILYRKP